MLLMILILIIEVFISIHDVLLILVKLVPQATFEIFFQRSVEMTVKVLEVKGISVSFRVTFHPLNLVLVVSFVHLESIEEAPNHLLINLMLLQILVLLKPVKEVVVT